MANQSLWPVVGVSPPRTMAELLYDLVGDLGAVTSGKLDFYVDTVGALPATPGPVTRIHYNCFVQVVGKSYSHLFFQVTTPSSGMFPAEIGTPEGEHFTGIATEQDLQNAIREILQRPRTKEVLGYLLRLAPR